MSASATSAEARVSFGASAPSTAGGSAGAAASSSSSANFNQDTAPADDISTSRSTLDQELNAKEEALVAQHVAKLASVEVLESDIREMILNYFIVEGNQAAAEAWREEAFFPATAMPLQAAAPKEKNTIDSSTLEALDGVAGGGSSSSSTRRKARQDEEGERGGPGLFAPPARSSSSSYSQEPIASCSAGDITQANVMPWSTSGCSIDDKIPMPLAKIKLRAEIGEQLRRGEIEDAIQTLNTLSVDILKNKPDVEFSLLRRILVQKIADNRIANALAFAQERLTPFVEAHPRLLPQLEEAMALLAYPPGETLQEGIDAILGGPGAAAGAGVKTTSGISTTGAGEQSQHAADPLPVGNKMIATDDRHRNADLATRIDDVILQHYNISRVSQLEFLCKNVCWSQKQNVFTSAQRAGGGGGSGARGFCLAIDEDCLDDPTLLLTSSSLAQPSKNNKSKKEKAH